MELRSKRVKRRSELSIEVRNVENIKTIRELLALLENQNKQKELFKVKAETVLKIYKVFYNDIDDLINNKCISKRFAEVVVEKGLKVMAEMREEGKTRSDLAFYKECSYTVGTVVDLLDHYVIRGHTMN